MGLLTFSINVTLDGCVDHQEGIADDETHAFFTRLMDEGGAMLWGRVTYEMMESYWPAVARGDEAAPPAIREWADTTGPDVRLYNDANFGGYLIHTLPGRRIFMDDRFEQYGEGWTRRYVECIWHRPEAFDDWDRRWRFGLALVATGPDGPTPLDDHLTRHPGWEEVGRLPQAVLFRRR